MKNPVRDLPHYLKVFQSYLGWRMYYVFVLTIFASIAEGIGILMLLPLLQRLDQPGAVQADSTEREETLQGVSAFLGEVLMGLGLQDSVVAVLVIIAVAFVIKGGLVFASAALSAFLRGELLRELKERLFDQYSQMSYRYYSNRDTGYFTNLINEQITRSLQAFSALTELGAQVFSSMIYLVLTFLVAWRFGVMVLVVGVVLLFLFRRLNYYVRKISRKFAEENGFLSNALIQTLHAWKYLTGTGQTPKIRPKIIESIDRLTYYQVRTGIASSLTKAAREPISVVFIMLIVLIQVVVLEQPLSPILVSILLFHRGLNAVLGLQMQWQNMLEFIGSMELVHQEFKMQTGYREMNGSVVMQPLSEGIQFSDVEFSYDSGSGEPAVKSINLDIPVRSSVAFVGESGAGKSTLADLITLLHTPQNGKVLIDGVPSDRVELASWRKQIGYVSQETVVFDDTIANNICLWDGDPVEDSRLLDKIRMSAKQAHLESFIETLPQGYQTQVGDRGMRLSGGQRQRLFIARELFRDPSLLILDEATSALDSESEREIQRSIDELKGRITVVIIAHRLFTIRNVNQIYVLNRGELVEQGTYDSLRGFKGSRFERLVSSQAL